MLEVLVLKNLVFVICEGFADMYNSVYWSDLIQMSILECLDLTNKIPNALVSVSKDHLEPEL